MLGLKIAGIIFGVYYVGYWIVELIRKKEGVMPFFLEN